MKNQNILLLGSGGREHALAWKMRQSVLCGDLFIAPGNAGTSQVGINVPLSGTDFEALKDFCLAEKIDMLVVGPEEPLVRGVVDFFRQTPELQHITTVGPSAEGAQLEGSKAYAKRFMERYDIPTARYQEISTLTEGVEFLKTLAPPFVLKADGLAAGKGVLIIDEFEKAVTELEAMLGGKFGAASSKVVIEEFLSGIEFSVFVLTDGKNYQILPVAKDYKRVGEGDTGLNTGGMGAVSPVPFVDAAMMQKVETRIIRPTVEGLSKENIDYKGFIFIGLISVNGEPMVIEYNCRMGDPETEVVMPRVTSDLVASFAALGNGTLADVTITEDPRTATTIMLTAGGYPEEYRKGDPISNITEGGENRLIFHAGTKLVGNSVVTNGGRVIALTAFGDDIPSALSGSNDMAQRIEFEGKYYRRDIGLDLMNF